MSNYQSPERLSPQDLNAEMAVLSAMMLDSDGVCKAVEILKDNHFYKNAHRVIFKAIKDLFEQNIEVDIITLIHTLEEQGDLSLVGGKVYINEISDIVLSSANVEYHAKIVLDKAILRMLLTICNSIIKSIYDSEKPTKEILEQAEQTIFEICEIPHKQSLIRIDHAMNETYKMLNDISSNKDKMIGLSTGFEFLDNQIGGLKKGQLVIVAARPSMGKSSFALNIAAFLSIIFDRRIAIFSLEMSRDEISLRIISSEAGIPMPILISGQYANNQKTQDIIKTINEFQEKNIWIDDSGSNTVIDIKAKARRLMSELKGLDLIIIDYLQLMQSHIRSDNRVQEVSEISRGLKLLAKDLDLPVMALSQLSREPEKRTNKRPILSDLRESGGIEQDADVVVFIYRDVVYNKETPKPNVAELLIAKNRHGDSNITVELQFDKTITKFFDWR